MPYGYRREERRGMNHPLWHAAKRTLRRVLPRAAVRALVWCTGGGVRHRPRYPRPFAAGMDALIAYNRYGGFCIPRELHEDTPAQAILHGAQYEEETLRFLRMQKWHGDIVHAGAYFGDSLPLLSAAAPRGAKVWAFEPNPLLFRCAQITCLINGLENVALYPYALGAHRGEGLLKIQDEKGRPLGGTAHMEDVPHRTASLVGAEKVPVAALDEIIPKERTVSLMVLDVEGYEEKLLEGAARILARDAPTVVIEMREETEAFMRRWGYRFVRGFERRAHREGFRNGLFQKG